jgi:hypothetical protein
MVEIPGEERGEREIERKAREVSDSGVEDEAVALAGLSAMVEIPGVERGERKERERKK